MHTPKFMKSKAYHKDRFLLQHFSQSGTILCMNHLFTIALSKPRYLLLFGFTLVFSLLFAFSSQLEMFALGVIAKTGPSFFELFAPMKEKTLAPDNVVSKELLEERWKQLDKNNSGIVTKKDTEEFLQTHAKPGVINSSLAYINKAFPIETNIWYLVIALIFVALFKAVTLFCYRFGAELLAIRVCRDLRQSYFEHLQALPI